MSARAQQDGGLLALIPARGGSQRIPHKNVRDFFGHPMLAYAIAAAQNCGLFQRIVVSTDSPEIGEVAERYGAEFLKRPEKLANDAVGVKDVALHALMALAKEGFDPAAFCQLMPNCPLRRTEDIAAHYNLFARQKRRFQISVVPFRGVYPQWALTQNSRGEGAWLMENKMVNSQKLATTYCPTGAIWWARTRDFLEQKTFYGDPFHVAVLDANRGLDLDTMEDLELAELLVRGLREREGHSPLELIKQKTFQVREKHL